FATAALGQVGNLLKGMHLDDRRSYGFSSLTHVTKGPSADATRRVLVEWGRYEQASDPAGPHAFSPLAPVAAVRWFVGVDSLWLVVSYLTAFLAFFLAVRRRLREWGHEP